MIIIVSIWTYIWEPLIRLLEPKDIEDAVAYVSILLLLLLLRSVAPRGLQLLLYALAQFESGDSLFLLPTSTST